MSCLKLSNVLEKNTFFEDVLAQSTHLSCSMERETREGDKMAAPDGEPSGIVT